MGLYDDEKRLKYIGGVGTGFDERILNDLAAEMKPLETRACPFREDPQTKETATWVKPELVARVQISRIHAASTICASPCYLGLRRDIDASECRLAGEIPAPNAVTVTTAVASHPVLSTRQAIEAELAKGKADNVLIEIDGKAQRLSNLNKVYFPEAGFTKRHSAGALLPRRRVLAAVPQRPAAGAQPLPQRHPRQVVLSEGGRR